MESQLNPEEILRAFIQQAPVAIAMFDLDMRYLAASQKWNSTYGLSAEKIIGVSHYEIFPKIPESWKIVHRRAIQGETIRKDEDTFIRPGGETQWLRWEVRPWILPSSSIGGILIYFEDITDLKKKEIEINQLYQREKNVVAMRDYILSIVAHDLRNPISTIMLAMKLFQIRTSSEAQEQQDLVNQVFRSLNQMLRLINDLLDFSKLESGEFQLEQRCEETKSMMEEILKDHSLIAKSKRIQLSLVVAEDIPQMYCDRKRIRQVIANLIDNAIKFTPEGGAVTLKVATRRNEFLISVSDTGCGILAEKKERIFDRYWQASATGRSGVGLGLSIAKGIVNSHAGKIWVDSTEGKGSTFSFTIPFANTCFEKESGRITKDSPLS